MEQPIIRADQTRTLADARFIKLYDLAYEDGRHYFEASRREAHDLLALRSQDEIDQALPDAVSCCLVVEAPGEPPRIVMTYEYRYPTGQYVLGIPSGLIDERDIAGGNPLVDSMTREIGEECGIRLGAQDDIWVINSLLFNTPGLTDESTALLCAVAHVESYETLSQAGAEGSEQFAGFELLTQDEARAVLAQGRDPHGHFYPMVSWAALAYFASGFWRDLR